MEKKKIFFGKLRHICLLLLTLSLSLPALAQTQQVEGTVYDSQGEPVIGASVVEVGTSNGVATDFDGHFKLNVNAGARLRVSFIGYQTKEVKASNSLKVILADDSNLLEEVKFSI